METFTNLLLYIRKHDENSIITRKDIIKNVKGRKTTLDQYRQHFTNAGYLEHVGLGKYKLIDKPPLDLYARKLRKESYPWWREWYEYRRIKTQNTIKE